jgi:PAS domain S-box-containing protein
LMGAREEVGVESSNLDNQQNGATRGNDRPTHASGTPGEDEQWLHSVLENSSEVIKIVDPDGILRYANPAFGRILGYESDKAVGTMNVLDHVHPNDLPRVLEETEKVVTEGDRTTKKVEYRFRHANGSWKWVESVGTYLPDDPAVRGVVVTVRAVTKRKESEKSEERFRTQSKELAPHPVEGTGTPP